MKREDIVRKLTSRKLWMSIASFISMLMVFYGSTESEAAQVASLVMAGATVIGYVLSEGLADSGNSIVEGTPIIDSTTDTDNETK